MLTRRAWLYGGVAESLAAPERANLLFIIADDHAGSVLHCGGNPIAETPNLDRLAAEGARFASHYCNSPVCTPSRQSVLTGLLPHAAGVTTLSTALDENRQTLAKHLRQAGYATAAFGKMHFNRTASPGLHGFEYLLVDGDAQRAWMRQPVRQPPPKDARVKPPWKPFVDPARVWLNADKLPYPRFAGEMKSTFVVQEASRWLEEHRSKPFALWISFQEPHSPFDFPLEDRGVFNPSRFEVPPVGPEDDWQIPLIFRNLTPEDKQGIIAAYYTSVRFMDRCAGLMLDRLRALNLERNTLVVFLGDNGYMLGQHGRFEKHCCYENAINVPLIMRWPGRVRRTVVEDLTESVDIAPTVLDVLGVDPLPVQHGRSLRPYLEGRRVQNPRDHIFSEYLENEEACVRTDRWKLIFCSGKRARMDGYETDNPTPGTYVRLYDLRRDPDEMKDVSARNQDVVVQLEGLMRDRIRRTHPEASNEPARGFNTPEILEWYLRPRDVRPY